MNPLLAHYSLSSAATPEASWALLPASSGVSFGVPQLSLMEKQGRPESVFWNFPIKIKGAGEKRILLKPRQRWRKLCLLWLKLLKVCLGTRWLAVACLPARIPPGLPSAVGPS